MAPPDLPPSSSASQMVSYSMCPRKYFFQYVAGAEPEFRSIPLVLGSAVHSAIGWWFEEKLAKREPTLEHAETILAADLAAESHGIPVRWKDSSPESIEADARRYLRVYLSRFGALEVGRVEEAFEIDLEDPDTGEVKGRLFKGYFDLVLTNNRVVEVKTSSKAWSAFDLVRHIQCGGYAYAYNTMNGGPCEVDVHVILKLKREPRVEVHEIRRGEAQTRWWLHAAWAIEEAIQAGHFPPNPSPNCAGCEYEKACAAWTGIARPHARGNRLSVVQDEGRASILIPCG